MEKFLSRTHESTYVLQYLSDTDLVSLSKVYPKLLDNEYLWSNRYTELTKKILSLHSGLSWQDSYFYALINMRKYEDIIYATGNLRLLQYLNFSGNLFPTVYGANLAAENGHLDVLEYLKQFDSNIHPDRHGVDWAAKSGHLHVLKYLERLHPRIRPSIWGANWAAEYGHLNVLRYLEHLSIHPTLYGANRAAGNGHLHVLKYLEHLKVFPDGCVYELKCSKVSSDEVEANWTNQYGHPDMLEDSRIRPDIWGANYAAGSGYLEGLEYLEQLDP